MVDAEGFEKRKAKIAAVKEAVALRKKGKREACSDLAMKTGATGWVPVRGTAYKIVGRYGGVSFYLLARPAE